LAEERFPKPQHPDKFNSIPEVKIMETKTNKSSVRYLFLALLTAMALTLVTINPVSAQEVGSEVEITGTVTLIDKAAGSFTVETEAGETHTILPGEGFDFSSIAEGNTVTVKGTLNEDGTVAALEVMVEEQDDSTDEDGDGEEEDGPSTGYYCTQSEEPHPFGTLLAERYETDYATLQAWFCGGFGWGQVMLALQTSEITGGDPGALLELRSGGAGWGEIWQELKLIGRPEHAGPPNDEDGDGKPDFAGPPNDEDGDGIPDFAGPPNDEDGDGKPDFAGPPDGKGPPAGRP
jgi:hypothetical protein